MSYDYYGAWDNVIGHNSPLYDNDPFQDGWNIDAIVKNLISRGVPSEKIFVGGSFYGRSWAGVKDKENPLFSIGADGPGPYTWEKGVLDYKDIDENYLNKNGYEYFFDDVAKASYLFDGNNFITYDSPEVIEEKASYVVDNDLGGVMFWELSSDNGKLLNSIHRGFGHIEEE